MILRRVLFALAFLLAGWASEPSWSQSVQPGAATSHAAQRAGTRPANFDGTNDYLSRGAQLTGVADTTTGLHFLSFRVLGGAGTTRLLTQTPGVGQPISIYLSVANLIVATFTDPLGTVVFTATNSTPITDTNWHNMLIGCDTTQLSKCKIYFDGADETTGAAALGLSIDYTTSNWFIGANILGSQNANVDMAVYYFSTEFLDITTEANRRKFVDAAGRPVPLGAKCERPTGSQPIICLNNPPSSFHINKGSGGDFTVNGSLSASTSAP